MFHNEVILKRRVKPQSHPPIIEGGDCGACAIAGILNITLEKAYENQDDRWRMGDKKKAVAFSWPNMSYTLNNFGWGDNDLIDAVIDETPMWPSEHHQSVALWGWTSWSMNLSWCAYIRMALQAGYYGFCSVAHDKSGPMHQGDHWVVICGIREKEEDVPNFPKAKHIATELLVSCSSRHPDGAWINSGEFLTKWGGFNVILVKPKNGD